MPRALPEHLDTGIVTSRQPSAISCQPANLEDRTQNYQPRKTLAEKRSVCP